MATDQEQYGFKRPEMYSANIANSIPAYGRHIFLCYKSPSAWLSQVENEGLPQLLNSSIKARKADIAVETKLTVCGGGETDGDVLIFPDMVRYKGLKKSDVDAFVTDVLVNEKPWASGIKEALKGSFVFVCSHASRDMRCGVCGPVLIEKFNQEIASRGLSAQILVTPCSHVGQHKYAGNLIIFCPDSAGKITGNWYGYVSPEVVPDLLDRHIAKGEILPNIWRGAMGLPTGEALKGDEQKLTNGNIVVENKTQESNGFTGGCCQGTKAVSCCREEKPEVAVKKEGIKRQESWFKAPEKDTVYLGAAMVGAAATLAACYSIYRRSG